MTIRAFVRRWVARTPGPLLCLLGVGLGASLWGRTWGLPALLEVACLVGALAYLPALLRRHYRPAFQDRRRVGWMIAALLVLVAPVCLGMLPGGRHVVATLLLVLYALPLLQSGRRPGILAFAVLTLGLIAYLLPFAVFQVERCRPGDEVWVAALQTNTHEALEYLGQRNAYLSLLLMGALALLLIQVGKGLRPGRAHPWRVAALVGLASVQFATGLPGHLLSLADTCRMTSEAWQRLAQARAAGLAGVRYTAEAGPAPRRILLILGESTTRRHFGLYGYPHPTTPRLEALAAGGGLTAFDDVVSPHTLTMPSLEQVLTTSDNEHPLPFAASVSVLDMFRRAGFHTVWISNQNKAGTWDDQASVIASAADVQHFPVGQIGQTFDALPDGVLVPLFAREARAAGGSTFAVCHLMGAHHNYKKRVPSDFEHQLRAEGTDLGPYDLAVRYGDWVVSELIRTAAEAGFDTVVYLPDHGEVPHEAIRHNPGLYVPEMVEIPFLVWLSPELRRARPELDRRVAAAAHRPWMSDDLIHLLVDLGGLRTSLHDPTRSPLNPAYRERPRRVIQGMILYGPAQAPHPEESL